MKEFLRGNCQEASIVYFNYNYTGERVGRALLGFYFRSDAERARFKRAVLEEKTVLRFAKEVAPEVMARIV